MNFWSILTPTKDVKIFLWIFFVIFSVISILELVNPSLFNYFVETSICALKINFCLILTPSKDVKIFSLIFFVIFPVVSILELVNPLLFVNFGETLFFALKINSG